MSDVASPPSTSRPRPVVYYGAFTAALGAFLGFAGLTDLMPKTVIAWIAVIGAVVTAGGAVLVQSTVTPLAAPRDARGVPMMPVDAAQAAVTAAVVTGNAPPVVSAVPPSAAGMATTSGPLYPDEHAPRS